MSANITTALEQNQETKRKPVVSAKRRRRQAGLTLIEILVVVTILGIIASIVGIQVVRQLDEAKIDTAKIQLSEIEKSLDLYRVKFHRYPTSAEGLKILESPPKGKAPIMDKVPPDPWGGEFVYVSPGQHNPSKYDLQSKGPDGQADTEDDVTNWSK